MQEEAGEMSKEIHIIAVDNSRIIPLNKEGTAISIFVQLDNHPECAWITIFNNKHYGDMNPWKWPAVVSGKDIILTVSTEDSGEIFQRNVDLIKRYVAEANVDFASQQKKREEDFNKAQERERLMIKRVQDRISGVKL